MEEAVLCQAHASRARLRLSACATNSIENLNMLFLRANDGIDHNRRVECNQLSAVANGERQ
jgi:hypothetical protein